MIASFGASANYQIVDHDILTDFLKNIFKKLGFDPFSLETVTTKLVESSLCGLYPWQFAFQVNRWGHTTCNTDNVFVYAVRMKAIEFVIDMAIGQMIPHYENSEVFRLVVL